MNGRPAKVEGGGVFATTHWSVVLSAARPDTAESEAALNWLCEIYWPAVFQYVRRTTPDPESARDLTQAFFAKLLSKEWLAAADRERGRFRTFLLTMVKRFLLDELDRANAQKRGGGLAAFSLDQLAAEEANPFEPSHTLTPDQEYDRRWAMAALARAMERLRAEAAKSGQGELFAALQGSLSGAEEKGALEVAQEFGLGVSAVKMRQHRWRARYRELIREEVAQTIPDPADLEEEMRHLISALST